jgi:hypothetical protein
MTLHIQGKIENIRKLENMGVREVKIDTEIRLEYFLLLRLLIN